MMYKVVPEKVMPQNIEVLLMGEDEELPELDAFTFLNRLRALGIGSADFLYLLKGCNAPESAVQKIERDPAMNLNALILTLEEAGITPQEYTRMLYTARQLWERTMTIQLQQEESDDVREYVPRAKAPEHTEPADYPEEEAADTTETAEEFSENNDDGFTVESILAQMESIASIPTGDDDNAPLPIDEREQPLSDGETDQSDEPFSADETEAEQPAEKLNITARVVTETTQFDEPFSADETEAEQPGEKLNITARVVTETTQFDEPFSADETEAEQPAEKLNITARVVTETTQFDKPFSPEDYDYDEDEPAETGSPYKKGALICSAAGAAVLIAAAAGLNLLGFGAPAAPAHRFAADNAEIFAQIYSAYNNGIIGNSAKAYSPAAETVFGGLLIEQDGFGTYSDKSTAYICSAGGITLYAENGAELTESGILLPPEGAEFVGFFEDGGALLAVFCGSESGFMRIENGREVFSASQGGALCDLEYDNGALYLGTVFTPDFSENFTIEQTDRYIPAICGEGITADRVLLSESAGCSYALSVRYNTADGSAELLFAALGDIALAGADGTAAVYSEGKTLFFTPSDDGVFRTVSEAKAAAAAARGALIACAEQGENGFGVSILSGGTPVSFIANAPENLHTLRLYGNTLLLLDGGGKPLLAADITNPAAPAILSLERANGFARGDYAVTAAKTDAGIRLELLEKKADGTCAELFSFEKPLSAQELNSLEFGGAESFFAGEKLAGAAYRRFDGVSVVSEFAVFGEDRKLLTLYDDKHGYTAAADIGGTVYAIRGESADIVQ